MNLDTDDGWDQYLEISSEFDPESPPLAFVAECVAAAVVVIVVWAVLNWLNMLVGGVW